MANDELWVRERLQVLRGGAIETPDVEVALVRVRAAAAELPVRPGWFARSYVKNRFPRIRRAIHNKIFMLQFSIVGECHRSHYLQLDSCRRRHKVEDHCELHREKIKMTTERKLNDAPGSVDIHLERMLAFEEKHEPFYRSFWRNIKETINPPKLPPLEVTSKPVAVKDIWGDDRKNRRLSGVTSIGVHVAIVALALVIGTNPTVQQAVKDHVPIFAPDLAPYIPENKPKAKAMGGGGGGGERAPLPPKQGKLPKPAPQQFVPPQIVRNEQPKLIMEPTLEIQPDANLPKVNMANLGDPLSKTGMPSMGSGSGAGFGSGRGGGVGPGSGAGFGPGSGGNTGGGVFSIGGGVSQPVPLVRVEPEYSEEARKAKYQGTVLLAIVVDENGKTRDVRVLRALGLGLDEKAIEAVLKWKFKPGYKDGRPVAVRANVEINFRLL